VAEKTGLPSNRLWPGKWLFGHQPDKVEGFLAKLNHAADRGPAMMAWRRGTPF